MSIKKKIKNNHTIRNTSNSIYNKLALIPLIIIISVIPFIIRMKFIDTGLSTYSWFSEDDKRADFFLYYKSLIFTIIALFMALYITWGFIKQKTLQQNSNIKANYFSKFTIALIPLAIYAILALLSTLFSDHISFGLSGINEQFESVFVLLGYCITVYYAFIYVNTEEDVQLIIKCLLFSVCLLSIIGFTQAIGHDLLFTTLGKKIMTPSGFWPFLDDLTFKMEKNRVYLTFYNPNYVGLYTAFIAPILLILLFFSKSIKLKFIYGITFTSLLLCLIGSKSRSGFVGLCLSFLFILILLRKIFLKYWKLSAGILGLIVLGFFSINAYMGNGFIDRLATMFSFTKTADYNLSSIQTNDNNVAVTYKGNTLYIQSIINGNTPDYLLTDSNEKPISITYIEATDNYVINDTRFAALLLKDIPFTVSNNQNETVTIYGFCVTIDGVNWYFCNQINDGTYYYYNNDHRFDKIVNADSEIFSKYESLGSGRGYIWSRTIPLLKDHILLGSGADTFVFEFPQNDYVGRYNNVLSSLVTKPHNVYLQMGVQTGVLSLISFLIFYGIYFVTSIKLYIKDSFETYLSQVGVALFAGTIGYTVSGLFNDSTITVSPVFWALIGVALAVNHLVKASKK